MRSWCDSGLPAVDENLLARMTMTYQNDPLFAAALRDAGGRGKPAVRAGDAAGDQVRIKAAKGASSTHGN